MDPAYSVPRRPAVLVVDDDRGIREALGLILEATYDVRLAEAGPPALGILSSRRIDAVLLDLGLPWMDGFEVLARIRSIAPSVPVIIVTVKNTAADAVRALKLGARDYLTKPFDEEIVLMKLAEALAVRPLVPTSNGERDPRVVEANQRIPPSANGYLRPRCLVIANHVGTAGILRLILDRYAPTNAAIDGLHAVQALGVGLPDCVVVDQAAWMANGSTFVRILRTRASRAHVALFPAPSANGRGAPMAGDDISRHSRLDEVVSYVLRTLALAGTTVAGHPLSSRVFDALDYLRLHHSETLRTDGIAQAAATSRSRLAQLFQAELGTSISQFVTTLRVEIAKLLLADRAAKVDQVGALAGFGDSSHLSRVFRARTGYRPGAYRRQFASS